jgi:membrane protein implicated in regulation of membrane protease activity
MHNMGLVPFFKGGSSMIWTASLAWWIGAAVLVGAELLTGTFYLLAIAIAFAAGGLIAWFGFPVTLQLLMAAAVAVVAVTLLRRWKLHGTEHMSPASLDVGQAVQVATWRADGTARVNYRGSQWDAELKEVDTPRLATLYIAGVRGSVLILSDRPPAR